ncbi:MAG: VCBS repeat-containing protein, partial [Deltaproteobacteria bacterium]|nr:VCBS repeat-containing protein [Deltaproteobacteria bacterium]
MKISFLFTLLLIFNSIHAEAAVNRPILKWKYGGCYSSWCETGWYSSPAVADLDNNGTFEVIGSAYSVAALKGTTGELIWRVDSGKDRNSPPGYSHRTWPGIWVTDVDDDGMDEIITAHSGGYVSVYNNRGYFKPGWPKRPTTNELRGLVVNDIDMDGTAEIIVTGATYNQTNTWVFEHTGELRSGWPQLNNSSGSAYGVFNDNAW